MVHKECICGARTSPNSCWECGKTNAPIHNHHPVPRVRGGKKTIPLCEECHSKAHHRKKNMNTSALVKEAIQKSKARGIKWGNKNLYAEHGSKAIAVRQSNATAYNSRIRKIVASLIKEGHTTIAAQASRLNELGIRTRSNKPFTFHNLFRILKRQII